MKLNIIKVLNVIAAEEASVELMKNFMVPTIEDIYREADERGEAYNPDFAKWAHIPGLSDFIDEWEYEMWEREQGNDQAADLCDWLMSRGESYDHVHFDIIRSFDEWMRVEKMPLINSYLVAA
jgi:hypothetical protein